MKGLGGLAAGGLGGGFGGFGKKKAKAEAPPEAAAGEAEKEKAPAAGATYGVLMETSSEMSGFSTAGIEAAKFETPAGYKEMAVNGK
jgi:hypothetical protein